MSRQIFKPRKNPFMGYRIEAGPETNPGERYVEQVRQIIRGQGQGQTLGPLRQINQSGGTSDRWYCKACKKERPAQYDPNGALKVRQFQTGFKAVFLDCGPGRNHTAAVKRDRV